MLANAATRSVLEGTDFGDNILAALPDLIVDTIGNVVKHGVVKDAAKLKVERSVYGLDDATVTDDGIDPPTDSLVGRNNLMPDRYRHFVGPQERPLDVDMDGARFFAAGKREGGSIYVDPDIALYGMGNLELGVNENWRDVIRLASKESGIEPQALAALIDAEAAKKRGGAWDPESYNSGSKAAGLTQFLEGTWLDEAKRSDTVLGQYSRKQGFVDKDGQVVKDTRSKLLDLRFNGGMSVMAAAQMAARNITKLKSDGLVSGGITPAQIAQIAYLAHHEGYAGARNFLKNNMNYALPTKSRKALIYTQGLDSKTIRSYTERAGGDVGGAYRIWLTNYVNEKIDVTRFFVKDQQKYLTKANAKVTFKEKR